MIRRLPAPPSSYYEAPPSGYRSGPSFSGLVTPGRDLASAKEWEAWLAEAAPDFQGDVKAASRLMACFSEGKSYVEEKLTSRAFFKGFVPPLIYIDTRNTGLGISAATMGASYSYIQINQSALEVCSTAPQDQPVTLHRGSGEIEFYGLIGDFFRATGVEETRLCAGHQARRYLGPSATKDKSTVEYYAADDEFQALRWKLRFLRERKRPQETIDFYQKILGQARELRAKDCRYRQRVRHRSPRRSRQANGNGLSL